MKMTQDERPNPPLAELIDELKPVPGRDPGTAARARARFLAQAVSMRPARRHTWWTIFPRKEQFAMNLLVSALVAFGLLFGGASAVSAAQDDLPNEPLYQLKLLREEAQLWLNSDPAAEIQILMEQSQTRAEEMAALSAQGVTPPGEVARRLQTRLESALQLTAGLDDPQITPTLERIREQLRTEEQLMTRSQDGTCVECDPILAQTRSMLQTRLHEVDGGLADPQTFRKRYQNQNQIRLTQTPPVTSLTPVPQGTCTPGLNCPGPQNTPAGAGPSSGNGTPGPSDNGGPGPGPGGPPDDPGGGSGNGNGGGSGGGNGGGNGR